MRKVLGAERSALDVAVSGRIHYRLLHRYSFGGIDHAAFTAPGSNAHGDFTDLYYGHQGIIWIGLLILSVVLGILSGAYPALCASGFHPLQIFRKLREHSSAINGLRKMLVSSQFIISITLIAGTVLVFQQLTLLRTIHLGFDKEKTLIPI